MLEVASVHILTQPEYFTSTLGSDLLSKFYTEYLNEEDLFIIAIDDETDRIVGFCMGNYFGCKAEKKWEQKYKKEIMKRLAIKCLQLNRLALSRSFRRVKGYLKKQKNNGNPEKYFSHLLSLGVLEEYRGNHIASTLIDLFEERCLQNPPERAGKEGACTIGAYKWNTAGCKLYEYKGYKVYEESKTKLKFTKELRK